MSEHKRTARRDPAQTAAEEQARSGAKMTLTPLKDGTRRLTDLKLGDENKRYWHKNEKDETVWEAFPEVVTLPDCVSVIGHLRCPILGEIVLPPRVREIDDLAFGIEIYTSDEVQHYALHTVHLSQGLRRIGWRAFYNCHNLDGVHLPKGLAEIDEDAFRTCSSLSRITIPESVDYIAKYAFAFCSSLEKVVFREGCTALGEGVFRGDKALRTVLLPATLTAVCYGCFEDCESLTALDLPESLTDLFAYAFKNCRSLKSLCFKRTLNNRADAHKQSPFTGCESLTEIRLEKGVSSAAWLPAAPALLRYTVPADHPTMCEEDGVLYSKDKKQILRVPGGYVGEFTLPRGVTVIAQNAFRGCEKITEVILPSSLVRIEEDAFLGCASLRSIDLPGKLTEVGARAFADCRSLTHAHISGSVRLVEEDAFRGCNDLTNLTVSPQNRTYKAEGGKLVKIEN